MESNTYLCQKCNRVIVTCHDNVGTTPFMLRCRATEGCDGMMQSQFGRVRPGAIPTHEWFRRTDIDRMTPEEFEHHMKGGAFIRRLDEPDNRRRIRPSLRKRLNLRRPKRW